MTHKNTILTAAVLISTLALVTAYAQKTRGGNGSGYGNGNGAFEPGEGPGCPGGRGMHKHGKGDRGMRWIEQVDLTDAQKSQIDTIREEKKTQAAPLRESVRALKEQMRVQWQADVPSEGEILALHRQIHDIKGQLAELRIQTRIDVIAVLTPEQRAEAQQFMAERAERRAERRGKNGKGERDRI